MHAVVSWCRKGFSLVEMVVVIAIVTILIGSASMALSGGAGKARRVATDQVVGMIEQARSRAMVSRSTVMVAIAEPGALPWPQDNCALGLLQVEGDWDPSSSEPVSAKLLGRWRTLEKGMIFFGGESETLANPLDLPKVTVRYTTNRAFDLDVYAIAFNARGRLVYPVGSVSAVLRMAEGGYPGGVATPVRRGSDRRISDSWLKIGRVTGRAYEVTP